MSRVVYMDHNATTPLHPEVKDTMVELFDVYGNPSSMHAMGREARKHVETAREKCASLIKCDPKEFYFTAGGSETNNTILKMSSCGGTRCGGCFLGRTEIVTSKIEHPSVLETLQFLEAQGVPVHYIPVDKYGKIIVDEYKQALSEKTALVSIMAANNEIGTIQDIKLLADLAHEYGALFHTDAVQAVGKIDVDVNEWGVDYLSCSGHKIYGPKGIGGMYVRNDKPYCTFIHGGHQEEGRRAGTTNTLGIGAFGKAAEMAEMELKEERIRLRNLRNLFMEKLSETIPDIHINGHPEDVLPGTLNVSFRGAEGESILLYMDMAGIAVSTGSACASGSLDPSHVILATGLNAELAHGSIRFSLGRDNTEEDVYYTVEQMAPIIQRIRSMSTVY